MSRHLFAFGLVLAAAACGGGEFALRDIDDACSIVSQRPNYLRAMQKSEDRWGVPVAVQMATIYQESKFIGDARTPVRYSLGVIPMGRQSSAYGYAQVLDATWRDYKRETGNWGARRDDIQDATDFIGWYMDQTQAKVGVRKTDARNQYLAYHEGQTGYARGSYRSKRWLVRIANDVSTRAVSYDLQLRSCGRA